MSDTGCPCGTTVIVRDLFYNVPARQKFLKKDSAESAAAAAVTERIALSNPSVAFSFTNEGERRFYTSGDGNLLSAVYSVHGRVFANGLKAIDYSIDGVRARGCVTTPANARGSRSLQIFFVNGRFIRSKTIMAALEEAFRSYLPHGKYPAGIINITLDAKNTDVNVHPAKLEIKFADERKIFETVYYAVKNMLSLPEPAIPAKREERQIKEERKPLTHPVPADPPKNSEGSVKGYEVFKPDIGEEDLPLIDLKTDSIMTLKSPEAAGTHTEPEAEQIVFTEEEASPYKIIGEAYNAYIFVQLADRVLVIDKHAAHERVLYNSLTDRREAGSQFLLEGFTVTLPGEQAEILSRNLDYLREYGFIAEPFGDNTLIVRAVPSVLADTGSLQSLFEAFAAKLSEGNALSFAERVDRALFTVACKAAMKAGQKNHPIHNEWLVERLLMGGDIKFCPHGRPVAREITRREIERFFDR